MSQGVATFLLVEDDGIHGHLVTRSLDKTGQTTQVVRVSDGAEALAYLRPHGRYAACPRPNLVLLDLNLPKIDGHGPGGDQGRSRSADHPRGGEWGVWNESPPAPPEE